MQTRVVAAMTVGTALADSPALHAGGGTMGYHHMNTAAWNHRRGGERTPALKLRGRPAGETAVEDRFLARCGFAWRHICRDAPAVAQRYTDHIQGILKGTPKVLPPIPLLQERTVRTPPGLAEYGSLMLSAEGPAITAGDPQQFCIASDAGEDDSRWRALEERVAESEEKIRELVAAICNCPFQDMTRAGSILGPLAERAELGGKDRDLWQDREAPPGGRCCEPDGPDERDLRQDRGLDFGGRRGELDGHDERDLRQDRGLDFGGCCGEPHGPGEQDLRQDREADLQFGGHCCEPDGPDERDMRKDLGSVLPLVEVPAQAAVASESVEVGAQGSIVQECFAARVQARRGLSSATSTISRRCAGVAWIRNERRLAMERGALSGSQDPARSKVLCRRARRLQARVWDRPEDLVPHLDTFEGAQPWCERLLRLMADVEGSLMGF